MSDAPPTSPFGRFCCKSRFAQGLKNSPGCRGGFGIKMRGTSSRHAKLTGDFGKATEATESAVASRFVFSRKIRRLATSDFCNKIGTTQTFRHVRCDGRFRRLSGRGRSSAETALRDPWRTAETRFFDTQTGGTSAPGAGRRSAVICKQLDRVAEAAHRTLAEAFEIKIAFDEVGERARQQHCLPQLFG